MKALLAAALLSGAFALSCGDEESSISTTTTPSPTASIEASPSPTAAPAASPTRPPDPLPSLAEALAGGETLLQRPLELPNLVYGVKEGKHVRVFLRDVASGNERLLLEYDEDVEAKHSSNTWQEEAAAIGLAESGLVVYVRGLDLHAYDVASGVDHRILQATSTGPALAQNRWTTDSGLELCCGYHLARPVVSADGQFVALAVSRWEGAYTAIAATDGSSVCRLQAETQDSLTGASLDPQWSAENRLVVPSYGEYAATGLFITRDPVTCGTSLSASVAGYLSYMAAAWSPDALAVAFAVHRYQDDPVAELYLFRKGSTQLLQGNVFAKGLLFSPDGRYIYYAESESAPSLGLSPEVLNRYDVQTGEVRHVAPIPSDWHALPTGWLDGKYIVLNVHSSKAYYWSTGNRIALLDPETGGVVYTSAASDFTRFAGFLP